MHDKTLQCKDCGNKFLFPVRDQEFFAENHFVDPVRCPNCRRARKQQKGLGK